MNDEQDDDLEPEPFGECAWCGKKSHKDLRLLMPAAWRSTGFVSPGPGWERTRRSFPIYCSDECQRKDEG